VADRGRPEAGVDGDVVGLVDRVENILDAALDRRRRDAGLGVLVFPLPSS